MGGGLLQLVAYGAQDVYITGNPQVTFFKLVYRRHTNSSMETIEQTFNGTADFGRKVTCTLSRNGDLIHKVWLEVDIPPVTVPTGTRFRWLNWLGHIMIDYVEFEIGGQKIDKQYGEWMHIWSELTCKPGHAQGYAAMVGNTPALTNMRNNDSPEAKLYIPLQFYFCKNAGLAVPLVALQYHEVKITVSFRQASDCFFSAPALQSQPSLQDARLLVDYIFLDSDERRRFAQVSHEYLITQIQFTGDESTTNTKNKFKLSFNHPTKEIVWVVRRSEFTESTGTGAAISGKQWFNFSDSFDVTYLTGQTMGVDSGIPHQADIFLDRLVANAGTVLSTNAATGEYITGTDATSTGIYSSAVIRSPVNTSKLVLNGHDRFSERDSKWFNLCVPYACHENIPSTGIHVYSFALRPEEHQPTGSINFSRIDTANLHVNLHDNFFANSVSAVVKIYAVSYNILRILSGMGGLAYSN